MTYKLRIQHGPNNRAAIYEYESFADAVKDAKAIVAEGYTNETTARVLDTDNFTLGAWKNINNKAVRTE